MVDYNNAIWNKGSVYLEILRPKKTSSIIYVDGSYYNIKGEIIPSDEAEKTKLSDLIKPKDGCKYLDLKYYFTGEMIDDENAYLYLYRQRFHTDIKMAKWELASAYNFSYGNCFTMEERAGDMISYSLDVMDGTRHMFSGDTKIEIDFGFLTEMKLGGILTGMYYSSRMNYNQKRISANPHRLIREIVGTSLKMSFRTSDSDMDLTYSILWFLKVFSGANCNSLETFHVFHFNGFLGEMFKNCGKEEWSRFLSTDILLEELIDIPPSDLEDLMKIDSFRESPQIIIEAEKALKSKKFDVHGVVKQFDKSIGTHSMGVGSLLAELLRVLNQLEGDNFDKLLAVWLQ